MGGCLELTRRGAGAKTKALRLKTTFL